MYRKKPITPPPDVSLDPIAVWVNGDSLACVQNVGTARVVIRRRVPENTVGSVVDGFDKMADLLKYEFEIWVGHGMKRFLSAEQLPEEVKSKLAMITATGGINADRPDPARLDEIRISSYISFCDPEFLDVGWHVSRNIFCVVMSIDTLLLLQGVPKEVL